MKIQHIAGIILILAFLISCRITKDTKAVERVTASKTLLNRVKPSIDSLWPCVFDTTIKFRPGRIDSIPYEVYTPILIDTTNRKRLIDSLINVDGACWELNNTAYNLGFEDAKKKFKDIKIPRSAPDTVDNTIVNRRSLEIANDARTVAEYKAVSAQSALNEIRKERNTLFWLVLVLIAALTTTIFFKIKSRRI